MKTKEEGWRLEAGGRRLKARSFGALRKLGMLWFFSLFFIVCSSSLQPQASSLEGQVHDTARGPKVLEEAIQALGGPAYLSARDYRAEGRAYQFSQEQLSGMARIVVYEKFPDKYRQEIEKDIVFVLNGEHGWEGTFRGVRELPSEEIERIRLGRDLSVDNLLRFRLKEPGLEVAFIGTDLVDGRQAELVQIVDAQNRTVTIAFDQSSHLPVRREWERRDPKTRERELNVETLGKYLPVKLGKGAGAGNNGPRPWVTGPGTQGRGGPLLAPYYIRRERNGIKIFEVFLTEMSSNVRSPDPLFERPRGPDLKDGTRRR